MLCTATSLPLPPWVDEAVPETCLINRHQPGDGDTLYILVETSLVMVKLCSYTATPEGDALGTKDPSYSPGTH